MTPLPLDSSKMVTSLQTFQFLETTISQDVEWDNNINSALSKAQLRMHLHQWLGKHGVPQELLVQFYATVINSTLTSSIAVWFGIDHKMGSKQTASGL